MSERKREGVAGGSAFPRGGVEPALILLLASMPVLLAYHVMRTYWVPLPYWDEWFTPAQQLISRHHGTLGLGELFSQHNESRPFFPRLLMLLLAAPAGWDVRQEMVLSFLAVCAGAVAFYFLLRNSARLARSQRAWAWMLGVFFLFAPGGYENFLNARHFGNFVPGVALLCALVVNTSTRSLASKTITNALLAFLATFSMPNGLLLWLFAWPVDGRLRVEVRRGSRSSRWLWHGLYGFVALATIAGYFWHYHKPPDTPAFVSPFTHFGLVLHYLTLWCGNLFFLSASDSLLRGIVVLATFLLLAITVLILRRRERNWWPAYPWLALGFFTLASGLTAAMGRVGFGLQQALDQRYTSYSVFLYLAIIGLFVCLTSALRPSPGRLLAGAMGALLLLLSALLWGESFVRIQPHLAADREMRRQLLLPLRWAAVIPDNPDLKRLSPDPATATRARLLVEDGILRPPGVTGPLAQLVRQNPGIAVPGAGTFEVSANSDAAAIEITGWAALPHAGRRADCVVLGVASVSAGFRPLAVFPTGKNRPELNGNLRQAGFHGTITRARLGRGAGILAGWAIDLKNRRAYSLAGAVPLASLD